MSAALELLSRVLSEGPADVPDTGDNRTVYLALIYVVGGGIFALLGTIVAAKVGRRVPVAPDPDEDYRKALDLLNKERARSGALAALIGRLDPTIDPARVKTGWEDLDRVRRR